MSDDLTCPVGQRLLRYTPTEHTHTDGSPCLHRERSGKERRDPKHAAIRIHIHDGLHYGARSGSSCPSCHEIQLFRKRAVMDRRHVQAAKLKAEEPIPFYAQEGVCLLHANPYCEKCNVRSGKERRADLFLEQQRHGWIARGRLHDDRQGRDRRRAQVAKPKPAPDFIGDGPGEIGTQFDPYDCVGKEPLVFYCGTCGSPSHQSDVDSGVFVGGISLNGRPPHSKEMKYRLWFHDFPLSGEADPPGEPGERCKAQFDPASIPGLVGPPPEQIAETLLVVAKHLGDDGSLAFAGICMKAAAALDASEARRIETEAEPSRLRLNWIKHDAELSQTLAKSIGGFPYLRDCPEIGGTAADGDTLLITVETVEVLVDMLIEKLDKLEGENAKLRFYVSTLEQHRSSNK